MDVTHRLLQELILSQGRLQLLISRGATSLRLHRSHLILSILDEFLCIGQCHCLVRHHCLLLFQSEAEVSDTLTRLAHLSLLLTLKAGSGGSPSTLPVHTLASGGLLPWRVGRRCTTSSTNQSSYRAVAAPEGFPPVARF